MMVDKEKLRLKNNMIEWVNRCSSQNWDSKRIKDIKLDWKPYQRTVFWDWGKKKNSRPKSLTCTNIALPPGLYVF